MYMPHVDIIIPTKSNVPMLINAVSSIQMHSTYGNCTVHVADTGSTEEELDTMREFLADKNSVLHEIGEYRSFAWINNTIVHRLEEVCEQFPVELLLFMNDDVELINDCVTLMVDFWCTHVVSVGTIGARLHYKNGRIQHAGMLMTQFEDDTYTVSHRGIGSDQIFDFSRLDKVIGNTGALMMVHAGLFREVGGFPSHYTDESEDIEFNLRCLAQGRTNCMLGYACAFHYEHQTRAYDETTKERATAERQEFLYPLLKDPAYASALSYVERYDRRLTPDQWSLWNSAQLYSQYKEAASLVQDMTSLENRVKQEKFEQMYSLPRSDNGQLHILYVAHPGGCGYVRAELPAKYLNERIPHIAAFPTAKVTPELFAWAHMIVWHMPMPASFTELRNFMARSNIPQIVDSDDNCFALDPLNPSKLGIYVDEIKQWMGTAGNVTVTRKALAEYYSERVDNIQAAVLPNCVDFERVPEMETAHYTPRPGEPVRIGWMGGRSHYTDLRMIAPVLRRLAAKYGSKLEIHMFGWDGRLPEMYGLPPVFEGLMVRHTPGVTREEYERVLQHLKLDVCFIPLTDTIFNKTGKSPIKWLEAASLRIPCVVADMDLYTDVVGRENSEKAPARVAIGNTEEAWEEQLVEMIDNPDLRVAVSDAGYEHARNTYDMAGHIERWAAYYCRIAAQRYDCLV